MNATLIHERTTVSELTVWQDWDAVQDKCRHVVVSLCLISSANKVHFRENRVVLSCLKPYHFWVIHFEKYKLGSSERLKKKKNSIQSSKRLSSLDVNVGQVERLCCISIIRETAERLQQMLLPTIGKRWLGFSAFSEHPRSPVISGNETINHAHAHALSPGLVPPWLWGICISTSCGLRWATNCWALEKSSSVIRIQGCFHGAGWKW